MSDWGAVVKWAAEMVAGGPLAGAGIGPIVTPHRNSDSATVAREGRRKTAPGRRERRRKEAIAGPLCRARVLARGSSDRKWGEASAALVRRRRTHPVDAIEIAHAVPPEVLLGLAEAYRIRAAAVVDVVVLDVVVLPATYRADGEGSGR